MRTCSWSVNNTTWSDRMDTGGKSLTTFCSNRIMVKKRTNTMTNYDKLVQLDLPQTESMQFLDDDPALGRTFIASP